MGRGLEGFSSAGAPRSGGARGRVGNDASQVLWASRDWFDASEWLRLTYRGAEHPPNGLLIPGGKPGAPVGANVPNNMIARSQRRASIVDANGNPRIVYHGLRHTCASILICRGMPLFKVSRFLGHACVAVTEGVYARLLNAGELDELAEVFDAEPWARGAQTASVEQPDSPVSRERHRVELGVC